MKILDALQAFINKLEKREFYMYSGIALCIVLVLLVLGISNHYRSVNKLKRTISNINELREEAKQILEKSEYVKKQRAAVDELLSQDEDFKIGGYFKTVLANLGLERKKGIERIARSPSTDEKYTEITLSAQFSGMDMKEVCELLNNIEQKERIYSKDLEIMRSKRTPQALDVSLTIATLQPQEVTA